MLIIGDDEQAGKRLPESLKAGGLGALVVRALRRAQQLEGLGLEHRTLSEKPGPNRMSVVHRLDGKGGRRREVASPW